MKRSVRRRVCGLGSHDSCVQAGRALHSYIGEGTVIYPANVRGLVGQDDLRVPYSELAMHVGAAGRKIAAFGCRSKHSCGVVWVRDDGGCGFVEGAPSEVMRPQLLKQVSSITGIRVAGIRSRR